MHRGPRSEYSSHISLALYLTLASVLQAGDLVGRIKSASRDAIIAIIDVPGQFAVHDTSATMDQEGMRFSPRILPIMVGSDVLFPNSERILYHNVYSVSGPNSFNLGTYRAGQAKSITFNDTGVVEILCNIHVRMYAAIIVLENPFFSVIDDDGLYRIGNIPAGSYAVELYFIGDYEVERRRIVVDIPQDGEYILDFE